MEIEYSRTQCASSNLIMNNKPNRFFHKLVRSSVAISVFVLLFSGCSSEKPFDGTNESFLSAYSGYTVVTSISTDPATGPGIVSLFDSSGNFIETLRDLFPSSEWSSGSTFVSPDKVIIGIANGARMEQLNLATQSSTNFTTARMNGAPNRSLVQDTIDGTIYLVEQNGASSTIEKYDSDGNPIGAPFIVTSVGSCVLNNPTSIAFISTNQNVAVIQVNRLNIYSKTGSCVATVTAAPFSSNTPYALAYHALTDKLIVAFAGNHSIYACTTLGTGCVLIYLSSSIINTPRSLAVDSSGSIYVGSSGTDTVEKLLWEGSGSATRVGTSSFIGPGIYSQNPTSIMVIP